MRLLNYGNLRRHWHVFFLIFHNHMKIKLSETIFIPASLTVSTPAFIAFLPFLENHTQFSITLPLAVRLIDLPSP